MKRVLFIVICGLFIINLFGCDKIEKNNVPNTNGVDNNNERENTGLNYIYIKVGETINIEEYLNLDIVNYTYSYNFTYNDIVKLDTNKITGIKEGKIEIFITKSDSNGIIGTESTYVL